MAESKHILPRVTFRFTDELRARLEKAALTNQRSVNAEVVARLEASFDRDMDDETVHRTMQRMLEGERARAAEIADLRERLKEMETVIAPFAAFFDKERGA